MLHNFKLTIVFFKWRIKSRSLQSNWNLKVILAKESSKVDFKLPSLNSDVRIKICHVFVVDSTKFFGVKAVDHSLELNEFVYFPEFNSPRAFFMLDNFLETLWLWLSIETNNIKANILVAKFTEKKDKL